MPIENDGKIYANHGIRVKDTPDTLRILEEFRGLLLPPTGLMNWDGKVAWPTFDAHGQRIDGGTLTIFIESKLTPQELRYSIASFQHALDMHTWETSGRVGSKPSDAEVRKLWRASWGTQSATKEESIPNA